MPEGGLGAAVSLRVHRGQGLGGTQGDQVQDPQGLESVEHGLLVLQGAAEAHTAQPHDAHDAPSAPPMALARAAASSSRLRLASLAPTTAARSESPR